MAEWRIKTKKLDAAIRYAMWGPKDFSRCVVYLQGRNEWFEKYDQLPDQLNLPKDCAVLAIDHRGQGGSGDQRAYIESYDIYANDLADILDEEVGDKPYVLMCHSMGGLIGLYAIFTDRIHPTSFAASAPLLQLPEKPIPLSLAMLIAKVPTFFGLGRVCSGFGSSSGMTFENNILTHDPEMYKIIDSNPYCLPGVTFGWASATFDAISLIHNKNYLAKSKIPLLIMIAGQEQVVSKKGQLEWCELAKKNYGGVITHIVIEGALHELYAEAEEYRVQALTATREWFSDFLS